jgi:hypothetical protein
MSGFSFQVSQSGKDTESYLKKLKNLKLSGIAAAQAQKGVAALQSATPRDSGIAASSWGYNIEEKSNSLTIHWTNSDIEGGFPVAVMVQYGHGTGTGGWVQGRDYINPAMRPIFDQIADTLWKAVTSA